MNRYDPRIVLPRWWAGSLLLLIAVTYRLWIPQHDVPAVPLVSLTAALPSWFGWIPLVVLVSSLSGLALTDRTPRELWWIVAAALVTACLLDQHRLQPWAYQSMIYATLFASMSPARAARWIMPLAISIYIYSGLGKLDYQFAHTVGRGLFETLVSPMGDFGDRIDQATAAWLALLLPATECLVGCCLIWKRLRRVAGVLVIVMHVTLIGLLGPWGLSHSLGVLMWNVTLIGQAWLLFVGRSNDSVAAERQPHENLWTLSTAMLAKGLVLFALLAPLTERFGYWDHWLSWALYAPHTSRLDLEIHQSQFDQLDTAVRPFIEADQDGDGWHRLSLGDWSLKRLGVPVYPQARYQLGLACELAERAELNDGIRGKLRGVADRWTGERREGWLLGAGELQRAKQAFWFLP